MPAPISPWLLRRVSTGATSKLGKLLASEQARRELDAAAHEALVVAVRSQLGADRAGEVDGIADGIADVLWGVDSVASRRGYTDLPLLASIAQWVSDQVSGLGDIPSGTDGVSSQLEAMSLDPSQLAIDFVRGLLRSTETRAVNSPSTHSLFMLLQAGRGEMYDERFARALDELGSASHGLQTRLDAILRQLSDTPNPLPSQSAVSLPARISSDLTDDSTRLLLAFRELSITATAFDQLPNGGWGRSLATWMDRYSRASRTSAPSRPAMRENGGIDITCATLRRLLRVSTFDAEIGNALSGRLALAASYLVQRTGRAGAIGTTTHNRTQPTEVRVRHTAAGLSAMLAAAQTLTSVSLGAPITRAAEYLTTELASWRLDSSGGFGLLASCFDLLHLLQADALGALNPSLRDRLWGELLRAIDDMADDLTKGWSRSTNGALGEFGTYGGLFALAPSSFLMHSRTFIEWADRPVTQEVRDVVDGMANGVSRLLDPGSGFIADTENGRLMVVPGTEPPRCDWGLTVQMLSIVGDARSVGMGLLDRSEAVRSAGLLREGLLVSLESANADLMAGPWTYTNWAQLGALLDDGEVSHPPSPALLDVMRQAPQALSEMKVCQAMHAVWEASAPLGRPHDWAQMARVVSRQLESGFYGVDQTRGEAWTPTSTTQGILETLRGSDFEEVPQEVDGYTLIFAVAADLSWIICPTRATSVTRDLLQRACAIALALIAPDGQVILPVRFNDHRSLTLTGESILFVEDLRDLELLVAPAFDVIRSEATHNDADGREAVVTLRAATPIE